MTLLHQLDRIPPLLYRFIARVPTSHGHSKRLTILQIAQRSGLKPNRISKISALDTWRGIAPEIYDAFVIGCGYEPLRFRKPMFILRRLCDNPKGLASARHLKITANLTLTERSARRAQLSRLTKLIKGQ